MIHEMRRRRNRRSESNKDERRRDEEKRQMERHSGTKRGARKGTNFRKEITSLRRIQTEEK